MPMPNKSLSSFGQFPFRRPLRPRPRITMSLLGVAVFNDQMPVFSSVQGVLFGGGTATMPLTTAISDLLVSGIAPASGSVPFFLEGTFGLYAQGSLLPGTAASQQASGLFLPDYTLNSLVFYNSNLYVLGGTQTQFGIMRYDATTGQPNGGASGPTDPMYLPGVGMSPNTGMGLVTANIAGFQGAALVMPLVGGVAACLLEENGAAVAPNLLGPVPYSAFQGQGLPSAVGLEGPCQGPVTGNVYFLYFDGWNPSGGAGVLSVTAADAAAALNGLSNQINVTVITPLGAVPLTGAWCVAEVNQQEMIYVAVPSWVNQTTPQWSIQGFDTSGNMSTVIQQQPGYPYGLCACTVSF